MGKAGRLIIEVKDEKGNLINRRIEDIHSYEHNWAAVLADLLQHREYCGIFTKKGSDFTNIVAVDESTPYYVLSVGKPISNGIVTLDEQGAKTTGIVLGYGNNQFDVTDTNLIQLVDTTKLVPQDMDAPEIKDNYPNEGQVSIIYQRNFVNQSGGDVKFNQVGLWIMLYALNISDGKFNGASGGTVEVIFDRLSQDVTVPNNATVTVTMELTFN